jgi:DNA-binding transcriptional ArsR family regulator
MTLTTTHDCVIDPERLRLAATRAVGMLKLLANEDRLLLLCLLSQGELCVSDLEAKLGIRQPTLSQQLGVLRGDGVVSTRRQGKNIYYRVSDPQALAILTTLYALYCPEGVLT